jgi:hypothetical protein
MGFLAPTASKQLRQDVETLMPLVRVELARITSVTQIDLEGTPKPTAATVHCVGAVQAVNKKDGMKGGAMDKLVLKCILRDGQWKLESYTSEKNWNRALGH